MHPVIPLPPIAVTVHVIEGLVLPAGLIRRGRNTLIIARAGLTRRLLRRHLTGCIRADELAIIRRSLGEEPYADLPPELDGMRLAPLVRTFRPGDVPLPLRDWSA